jgi:hypothetical protein
MQIPSPKIFFSFRHVYAKYEGRALKTGPGGLEKKNLKESSSTGKIVSIKRSRASKKTYKALGLKKYQYD